MHGSASLSGLLLEDVAVASRFARLAHLAGPDHLVEAREFSRKSALVLSEGGLSKNDPIIEVTTNLV